MTKKRKKKYNPRKNNTKHLKRLLHNRYVSIVVDRGEIDNEECQLHMLVHNFSNNDVATYDSVMGYAMETTPLKWTVFYGTALRDKKGRETVVGIEEVEFKEEIKYQDAVRAAVPRAFEAFNRAYEDLRLAPFILIIARPHQFSYEEMISAVRAQKIYETYINKYEHRLKQEEQNEVQQDRAK